MPVCMSACAYVEPRGQPQVLLPGKLPTYFKLKTGSLISLKLTNEPRLAE